MMNKPKLRFQGYTDDWEQRKLGDICQVTMGQSPDGSTYSDEPSDYILVQGNADLKDGWVYPRIWTTQKTKTAQVGDLIMSVRAPAGAMGKTAYDVVIGRGVAAIKGNEFIYQSLVKYDSDGYWKKLAAGSTFESVNSDAVKGALVNVPQDIEEQNKIGEYFKRLDTLITLHQRKCDQMKTLKKFMLQKMFPQNGAQVPEIRFEGFTDDWEQRKLEDYLEVSKEKNKAESFGKEDVLSVSGEFGIVNQIEFQGRSFAGASVANYGVVEVGDVVYTKSPLKSNPYGIIKTNKGKSGIVSTLYAVYKAKNNVDSDFVQIYFELDSRMNSYMHPLVNKGAKNDMKVSDENALKGPVIFPEVEEQRVISKCFKGIDELITLHQRKCEKLQEMKKFMLQNMFV